ncbi:RdRp [Hubei permutotetra-like virus 10]|uniref:RdRp n=1 Tax=Hubei permutotetra-like virus 10 TaxID=1923074 RepID=UPI00090ACE64|nr:RdRp [Hubei permutotetra-like virus 10]APG76972.1 RdRp [Hubei permutotetra-like virus 10]
MENIMLQRQDYNRLQKIIATAPRTPAPFKNPVELEIEESTLKRLTRDIPVQGTLDLSFLVKGSEVPLSPEHTPGLNQKGAFVSVNPVFKPASRDRKVVGAVLRRGGRVEDIEKLIYTTGSKSGFSERLKLWATARAQNPETELKERLLNAKDIIRKRLPVREKLLPDWNATVEEFVAGVTVNKSSSAGPPLYRPKYQCTDEYMDIISEIMKEGNQDHLTEYLEGREEFMIAQCKNKQDRYPPDKLDEKTRPYFNFCFPLQFYFSALVQPKTHCSVLFTESEDSWNAYGFSWANGGGEKFFKWMKSCREKEVKLAVYGDDVFLVKREGGLLKACAPDFRSMDGSVHKKDAEWFCEDLIEAFERQYGKNNFWSYFGKLLSRSLVGAKFLVDGPQAYVNETGLMTGCVGTTGVDTQKSVVAYACLLDKAEQKEIDLEDGEAVSTYFRQKFGLIVKENTYEWKVVEEELEEGEVPVDLEFLGVKLKMRLGKERLECVPFKEENDLVSLISNARIPPEAKGRATIKDRYLFDMARGYMITGAFHSEVVWNICCDLIEGTKTEIVCQRVQSGKKVEVAPGKWEHTGQSPELEQLVGSDFQWPTSDGWPSQEFCLDVYLSPDNKIGGEWYSCVPSLEEDLKKLRSKRVTMEAAKLKEQGPKFDWALDTDLEEKASQLEAVRDSKIDPRVDREGYLRDLVKERPLMRPAKQPKNFLRLKGQESRSKDQQIGDFLEKFSSVLEELPDQMLELVVDSPPGYYSRVMQGKGWRPNPDRKVWERGSPVPVNPHVWGRDILMTLPDFIPTEKKTVRKECEEDKPTEPFTLVPEYVKLLPNVKMDAISLVTGSFSKAGDILTTSNEVLRLSPDSWIKTEVRVRNGTGIVARAYAKSGKAAKEMCFENMLEQLKERERQPTSFKQQTEEDGNRSTESEAAAETQTTEREEENGEELVQDVCEVREGTGGGDGGVHL